MNPGFFVHETAVIDTGARIGSGTKIWHFCHVSSGSEIGDHCSLGQNVYVAQNVFIGSHVKIQNNVSVYEGVILENYVFCGPSVVFTNIKVPRSKYPQRDSRHYARTLVQEGASIGANATIVCGVTIGKHACIGAGSVVTSNVPDYAVVYGNPARQHGWMSEAGAPLQFAHSEAVCPATGKRYLLNNSIVTEVIE